MFVGVRLNLRPIEVIVLETIPEVEEEEEENRSTSLLGQFDIDDFQKPVDPRGPRNWA